MMDLIIYCMCQRCFSASTLKMFASDLNKKAQKVRGRITVPRLQRRSKMNQV